MTRVLLIEDSPTDTLIVQRLLERSEGDFVVETATTGAQAHQLLERQGYDCLVLDHLLPDTNSLEFLRQVQERYGTLPVVVITGQKHDWIRHSSLELGASRFLSKDEVLAGALPQAIQQAIATVDQDEDNGSEEPLEAAGGQVQPPLEALYRTLVETMQGGVLALDGEGNITFCNPQAGELMGTAPSELLGRSLDQYLEESEAALHRRLRQEVLSGEVRTCELELVRPDKSTLPIHLSQAPMRAAEGAITGSILVLSDLSDLRSTQAQLSQSQARYQTLIEIAPEAIVHFDLAGQIRYHNDQLCQLTGYPSEQLMEMGLDQLLLPEEVPRLERLYQRAVEKDRDSITFQAHLVTKEGQVRHVEVSTSAMEEAGALKGIIAYVRDDTQRFDAERQIQQAMSTAEFASDLLSHDINNLNQGTKGYLELLLAHAGLEEATERLARQALEQVESATQLIHDVRRLLDIRKQTPQLELVEQVGVLKQALERVVAGYPQQHINVELESPERADVVADSLLGELYLNLLDNGIKYNPTPEPALSVTVSRAKLRGTPAWQVQICDNGPGIPEERKASLFDRLAQRSTDSKGWGLGLSLVQALCDRYQGEVSVTDNPAGSGSCFKVLLPAATTLPPNRSQRGPRVVD